MLDSLDLFKVLKRLRGHYKGSYLIKLAINLFSISFFSRGDKANPLDEAPLSILQETEAMLKAQLAADSVDEALNISGGSNNPPSGNVANLLSSGKISYKLDSGSAIQYSVTTGEIIKTANQLDILHTSFTYLLSNHEITDLC